MELRHLRYFVALAEVLHFGRAARRLQITQPSLSHQVRQLESQLQTKLLERTKRHVELTEAGRLFLEEARQVLASADHAALVARRVGKREALSLRVGSGYCMDHSLIVDVVSSFSRHHSAARVEIQTIAVPQQISALIDRRLDVGFVRSSSVEPPLVANRLITEPLIVAIPRGHRLAKSRRSLDLATLSTEIFILVARETVPVYHDLVLRRCRESGFVPDAPHEADHLHLVLGMVAAERGISLVPAFAKESRVRGVVFRTLKPSPGRHDILEIAIARRSDAPAVVQQFVEIAQDIASTRINATAGSQAR
jgi:DNA-binding transcriptional LysR family regulator